MHFTLLTLFAEMFPGPLGVSIAGKALQKGLWSYDVVDIREFGFGKFKQVDDDPYGGGTGMVMRPDVLGQAIESIDHQHSKLVYMSPRGKRFDQQMAYNWVDHGNVSIVCGRYEGIDERVIEHYNIEEVSMGDVILSGGEMAALMAMDACVRLVDGVISKESALLDESFGQNADYAGLLEYPLYTRPLEWKSCEVPEVLTSGNHKKIAQWRLDQAKKVTKLRRPDLWASYERKDELLD